MVTESSSTPARPWLQPLAVAAAVALLVGFLALMARTAHRELWEYAALFVLTVAAPLSWSRGHATATGARRTWLGVAGIASSLGAFAFAAVELFLAMSGR